MINQADKPKDMARSILPSTWRGAWKKRAGLHRGERHASRQSLRLLSRDPESWDEGGLDFGDEEAAELSVMVRRRRAWDKLKHFERWAVERTKDLAVEDRLSHLRSLLPSGLIGQHAMVHLRDRSELKVPAEHDRRRWRYVRPRPLLDAGLISVVLRQVLEVHGGVRALHRALKSARREAVGGVRLSVPFRSLAGAHDVNAFVRWVGTEPTTRDVVDQFCREFRESGDVERAFARAVELARL
ncbi:MAG: hypothetical protein QM817_37430 [Archangium sp.]